MQTSTLPARAEARTEYTWDAASIFPNAAAFEAAFQSLDSALPALSDFNGKLGNGADTLLRFLQTQDDLRSRAYKLWIYADMFASVDSNDQEAAAREDRVLNLFAKVQSALAFGEPEILALAPSTLENWQTENSELARYAHYFDQLNRRRAHVRSSEVEELLGQVREPFGGAEKAHSALANADLKFGTVRGANGAEQAVAQGTIGALLTSPERDVRRAAWEQYADAFLAVKNTVAATLATGVKQNVLMARARRYDSALEASLSASHIPTDVFHNLIATYKANLPTWHRYWELRRRALKLDRLHVWDVKAPLTDKMPTIPFAQAVDWISEGLQPLGAEYVETVRRGVLNERWVDVYPNQGKRMGAYSSGTQGTHPFIFLSYNDDVFSMSTLAHELGHSLHSYLANQAQPFVYADYSLFVAEAASNFNQALVRAHLLQTQTDHDIQIALIEEAMSNFHRYFFVMPTLARFELAIHETVERGDALTADSLIGLLADLFAEGFGPDVALDRERVGITWAQFPTHLYSNFYVYTYATGISAAHALARQVLDEGAPAAARYLDALKAGGSLYPLDTLKRAGVDMTTPQPIEATFGVLAQMVDKLEGLVG